MERTFMKYEKRVINAVYKSLSYLPRVSRTIQKLLGDTSKNQDKDSEFGTTTAAELNRRLTVRLSTTSNPGYSTFI
jgi:hypothetical protein